ncbi:IS1634 family transposase [Kiritimatiella glycovorans]|nr:IS1634 family transposase [Kiritimatiella glycovorans]
MEKQYGKINRLWIMDRGIPTEDAIKTMREENAEYLVGTPRGRLTKLEKQFLECDWKAVQSQVEVKLAHDDGDLYVLTRSKGRQQKERSMRQRKLKWLWKRLHTIRSMEKLKRDDLLIKLGSAKRDAGNAWRLVDIQLPGPHQPVTSETFNFTLNRKKLKRARKSEGTYLLRTNLSDTNADELWKRYIVLTEIEQAFKELKHDLSVRPIYHRKETRIDAHIFVSFIAYSLHVTLKHKARLKAPGLTPRAILEKFKAQQMIDVHFPTTDGRTLIMPRYTYPERELQLLLTQLNLTQPDQPPPKIEQSQLS